MQVGIQGRPKWGNYATTATPSVGASRPGALITRPRYPGLSGDKEERCILPMDSPAY